MMTYSISFYGALKLMVVVKFKSRGRSGPPHTHLSLGTSQKVVLKNIKKDGFNVMREVHILLPIQFNSHFSNQQAANRAQNQPSTILKNYF